MNKGMKRKNKEMKEQIQVCQRINEEMLDRLKAENSKCMKLVGQLQKETEAELVAVHNKIEVIN
jgi:predicted metal-binding protein